jgi:phosphoribosylanthranilate isomerase
MALKTFVKISAVTNLNDARYCAGMYVNLMGFSLEENSKNYVSPTIFKEITDWLSGMEYVAEFKTSHPGNILKQIEDYPGIKYIEIQQEIHLEMLVNTSFGIILRQRVSDLQDIDDLIDKSDSYKNFDVSLLLVSDQLELDKEVTKRIKSLAKKCNVLLGFGVTPDNIEKILEKTSVKGIALQVGEEPNPDLKDFDDLADILEVLEED